MCFYLSQEYLSRTLNSAVIKDIDMSSSLAFCVSSTGIKPLESDGKYSRQVGSHDSNLSGSCSAHVESMDAT